MAFSSSPYIVYALDISKCLDAGDMSNGQVMQIWDCNGQNQQKFGFDSTEGAIYLASTSNMISPTSGNSVRPLASKCFDIAGGSMAPGTSVQVWDCNNQANQQWSIIPANSVITMQLDSTKCLDLASGDTTNGNQLQLWDCNGLANQQWIFGSGAWKTVPM